jgi:hypothetical protein
MSAAIALMRAEGLSDRRIAVELGVSKSSIRAMASEPSVEAIREHDVNRLAHQVWVDMADLAGQQFVVDGDDIPSFERMATHGIKPTLPASVGRADTASRQYVQMTSGQRILVFSQARWNGFHDSATDSGCDYRGRYLIERCSGPFPGECARDHTPIAMAELGLSHGDELYGSGWDEPKPTAHQVWKLLTAAIEERFEVFDPSYPELELRRRPGTTPRYPARPDQGESSTHSSPQNRST